MKKALKCMLAISLALIFCVFVASCKNDKPDENTQSQQGNENVNQTTSKNPDDAGVEPPAGARLFPVKVTATEIIDGVSEIYMSFTASCDKSNNSIKYATTDSDGKTEIYEYTYDANGILMKEVNSRSRGEEYDYEYVSEYTYNENGNLIKKIRKSPDGNITEYTYNENGNLIKQVDKSSDGHETVYEYTYDANGNLIKEVRPLWLVEYTYDENGYLIKKVSEYSPFLPDKSITEYTYDENGNLIKENYDPEGGKNFLEYTYDANNRLIKKVRHEDGMEDIEEHVYDANGILIKEGYKYSSGTEYFTEYTFGESGLLIKTKTVYTNEDGVKSVRESTYTYDENRNPAIMITKDSDGREFVYECTYDQNGRLIKYVEKTSEGVVEYMVENTYDESGNLLKFVETYDDGSQYVVEWEFDYLQIPYEMTDEEYQEFIADLIDQMCS